MQKKGGVRLNDDAITGQSGGGGELCDRLCSITLKWISDHGRPETVCTNARRSLTALSCFTPAALLFSLFPSALSFRVSCPFFWQVVHEWPFVAFLFAHTCHQH